MKIFKKIIKFIFSVLLIALLIASGYILYDYNKDPAKYDAFAQKFEDKITGEDQVIKELVNPFVTPEMTLTLNGSPYEGITFEPHYEFKPSKPIIMCYGKNMGGNLYVPIPDYCPDMRNPKLYSGPELPVEDISEYSTFDAYHRCFEIEEELLLSLNAGEYYIIAEFADNDSADYYEAAIALILEEETTFNSTDRGQIPYYDYYCWIYNDLENPKEITFTFYNLGDNTIRALLFDSERGGAYLTEDMDPADYRINEQGNVVTLTQDFLSRQPANSVKRFAVRLANGEKLDMGFTHVCTIKGDSLHPMTLDGPETYSLSAGGDYVATFVPNDCTQYYSCSMKYFPSDTTGSELFNESLKGRDAGEYIDTVTQTITLPAAFMQNLTPNNGVYEIQISYFIEDIWHDASLQFKVID